MINLNSHRSIIFLVGNARKKIKDKSNEQNYEIKKRKREDRFGRQNKSKIETKSGKYEETSQRPETE